MREKQKEISKHKGRIVLLVGGARSGKSTLAEKIASQYDTVAYIATAEPVDEEMLERIKKHRESRPKKWKTIEANGSLVASVKEAFALADDVAVADATDAAIIDCLTVYLARRMEHNRHDGELISEVADAVQAAKIAGKTVIMVSNEVGLGIVPEQPVSRRYRDLLGRANQKVAELADSVYFMFAGIPVDIKKLGGLGISDMKD
jgi:adenosyl cobinamide kinase/adenosyl cobinamide phosphate guanylyltransferase